jgi:hypothetical protein
MFFNIEKYFLSDCSIMDCIERAEDDFCAKNRIRVMPNVEEDRAAQVIFCNEVKMAALSDATM